MILLSYKATLKFWYLQKLWKSAFGCAVILRAHAFPSFIYKVNILFDIANLLSKSQISIAFSTASSSTIIFPNSQFSQQKVFWFIEKTNKHFSVQIPQSGGALINISLAKSFSLISNFPESSIIKSYIFNSSFDFL